MQNLPAFLVALEQTFQTSWHFRFQAVTKVFLLLRKTNHILAFTVVLTVGRNTQQVSVSMFINFPSVLFHAYH